MGRGWHLSCSLALTQCAPEQRAPVPRLMLTDTGSPGCAGLYGAEVGLAKLTKPCCPEKVLGALGPDQHGGALAGRSGRLDGRPRAHAQLQERHLFTRNHVCREPHVAAVCADLLHVRQQPGGTLACDLVACTSHKEQSAQGAAPSPKASSLLQPAFVLWSSLST